MSELSRPEPVFFHFRVRNPDGSSPAAKGGATVVYHPTKKKFGVALCCPKDRFCKRVGAKIALHRLGVGRNVPKRGRFDYAHPYSDSNEFEDVKFRAKAIVWAAAISVDHQDLAEILKTS